MTSRRIVPTLLPSLVFAASAVAATEAARLASPDGGIAVSVDADGPLSYGARIAATSRR